MSDWHLNQIDQLENEYIHEMKFDYNVLVFTHLYAARETFQFA